MKKLIPFIILVSTVYSLAFEMANAYQPAMQWQKTFGGSGEDQGWSVQQTSDGGYIVAGVTYLFGEGCGDVYLIKTDTNGNSEWQKTFGGSGCECGRSVQQTDDGGYIIAGDTSSYGPGGFDVYLIKTDPNGHSEWQNAFGGSSFDWGWSVQQTSDGGYIVAGTTFSNVQGVYDIYLVKTDSAGYMQWQKTLGGDRNDYGRSVQQTDEGGYIIVGSTYSYGAGSKDIYVIKADSAGNMRWQKTFGGHLWDEGWSVQQTTDGGYIITGWLAFGRPRQIGNRDVCLIKTGSTGSMQWQKTFGGLSSAVSKKLV